MDARPWQQRVRALDSNRSQQVLEDRGARGSDVQDAGGGVDGDGRRGRLLAGGGELRQ